MIACWNWPTAVTKNRQLDYPIRLALAKVAWTAMNSEPHLYKGDWQAVVRIAESALPAAWEIREWVVVVYGWPWPI